MKEENENDTNNPYTISIYTSKGNKLYEMNEKEKYRDSYEISAKQLDDGTMIYAVLLKDSRTLNVINGTSGEIIEKVENVDDINRDCFQDETQTVRVEPYYNILKITYDFHNSYKYKYKYIFFDNNRVSKTIDTESNLFEKSNDDYYVSGNIVYDVKGNIIYRTENNVTLVTSLYSDEVFFVEKTKDGSFTMNSNFEKILNVGCEMESMGCYLHNKNIVYKLDGTEFMRDVKKYYAVGVEVIETKDGKKYICKGDNKREFDSEYEKINRIDENYVYIEADNKIKIIRQSDLSDVAEIEKGENEYCIVCESISCIKVESRLKSEGKYYNYQGKLIYEVKESNQQ